MTLALNYEPKRMTEFNDQCETDRMASRLSANGKPSKMFTQ